MPIPFRTCLLAAPSASAYSAAEGCNLFFSAVIAFFLVHWVTANRLPFHLAKGKLLANLVCYLLVLNGLYLLFALAWLAGIVGTLLLTFLPWEPP